PQTSTLSLHDALPISSPTTGNTNSLRRTQNEIPVLYHPPDPGAVRRRNGRRNVVLCTGNSIVRSSYSQARAEHPGSREQLPCRKDRKSTRLNSSHVSI